MIGVDMVPLEEFSTTGTVTELADGSVGEDVQLLTTEGYLDLVAADRSSSHTVEIIPEQFGYLGELSLTAPDGSTPKPFDYLTWTFEVEDVDLSFLSTGETLVQSYDIVVTDPEGDVSRTTVEVTLKGADDEPLDDELNDFFGAIDEAAFVGLSGFINGLVDISRTGSETGYDAVRNAAISLLGELGGDTGYISGDTPLSAPFQRLSDGFDTLFDGARDGVNGIGDWLGDLAGLSATGIADFGNSVGSITGQPTPIIDQFEYYTLQLGGGLAYPAATAEAS